MWVGVVRTLGLAALEVGVLGPVQLEGLVQLLAAILEIAAEAEAVIAQAAADAVRHEVANKVGLDDLRAERRWRVERTSPMCSSGRRTATGPWHGRGGCCRWGREARGCKPGTRRSGGRGGGPTCASQGRRTPFQRRETQPTSWARRRSAPGKTS